MSLLDLVKAAAEPSKAAEGAAPPVAPAAGAGAGEAAAPPAPTPAPAPAPAPSVTPAPTPVPPAAASDEGPDTQLSKKLSFVLRHGAKKMGIHMGSDGFVKVLHLLAHPNYKGVRLEDVKRVVENNNKSRFVLQERGGEWEIRANQGHTAYVPDLELEELNLDTKPDIVVHGTNRGAWEEIRKTGLSKMERQHIHFAQGLPGAQGVVSGMRSEAEVLIYLDAEKALKAGITLLKSSNGVILSPGIGGSIPVAYFLKVVDATTQQPLPI